MYDRRTEDRLTARMLYLRPGTAGKGGERRQWRELRREEGADRVLDSGLAFDRLSGPDNHLLLLDLQDEGVWLMLGGAMARLPRPAGDTPALTEQAGEEAAAWLRHNLSRWRRLELPTNLIGYTQALAAADTPAGVCHALADACLRVFGGHRAFVFQEEVRGLALTPVPLLGLPPVLEGLSIRPTAELNSVGAVIPRDARLSEGQELEDLQVFFRELGCGILVHAPVGDDRVVFITERRGDRTISVEEWQILNLLIEQAEAAFRRIELYQEVRNLSLTDELTGLANRRHMRLVLEPAFAAARRGVPLTVLMLDLDGFKQVNDEQGHLSGDRVLRRVAMILEKQGRGSDLVVRFGGDEFLVVFPGGNRAAAESYAERVHARLEPAITFSTGIAEFDVAMEKTEDLIEAADRELYRCKREHGVAGGFPSARDRAAIGGLEAEQAGRLH